MWLHNNTRLIHCNAPKEKGNSEEGEQRKITLPSGVRKAKKEVEEKMKGASTTVHRTPTTAMSIEKPQKMIDGKTVAHRIAGLRHLDL